MAYRRTESRQRHIAAVRDTMIEAATALVREDGLSALTVRAVIGRAGSSIGNFHHYFGDKAGLIREVLNRVIDEIFATVDRAAGNEPPGPRQLAVMVYTGITETMKQRRLASALFAGEPGEATRRVVTQRLVQRVETTFAAYESSGRHDFPAESPLAAAMWQGTITMVVEVLLSGDLSIDAHSAACSCAAWNLRAIGVSDGAVEDAVARLEAVRTA